MYVLEVFVGDSTQPDLGPIGKSLRATQLTRFAECLKLVRAEDEDAGKPAGCTMYV